MGEADKCLRSLQYSLEHPVYHGGSVRAVGTAYHAGLEHLYDHRIAGTTVTLDEIVRHAQQRFTDSVEMVPSHESEHTKTAGEFRWDDKVPDHDTGLVLVASMLRAYDANPEAEWPSDWEVLETEMGFSQPLWNSHTRNGSMDLVLRDPDGFICGEDHKTSSGNKWAYNKHHARKQNQSPWYVAALMCAYPDAPGYRFFYDIMTFKGVFERRESVVTREHVAAIEAKAVQVVTLYEGMRSAGIDLPANPASNLCSPLYCDHWTICPYGQALDVQ